MANVARALNLLGDAIKELSGAVSEPACTEGAGRIVMRSPLVQGGEVAAAPAQVQGDAYADTTSAKFIETENKIRDFLVESRRDEGYEFRSVKAIADELVMDEQDVRNVLERSRKFRRNRKSKETYTYN